MIQWQMKWQDWEWSANWTTYFGSEYFTMPINVGWPFVTFDWLMCCVTLTLKLSFLSIVFVLADVHIPVMHHCSWDQPQPIYLHWQIYCCVFSSTWPYEDNTCFNNGVLFLWEGGSQSSRGFRDGNSCGWNDMVWQRLIKAWWKGALESLSPHQQNRNPIVPSHCDGLFYVQKLSTRR